MASRLKLIRRILGLALIAGVAYVGWLVAHVERHEPVVVVQKPTADLPKGGEEYGVSEGLTLDWDGGAFRHLEAGRATKSADGTFSLEGGLEITLERGPDQGPLIVRAQTGDLPPAEDGRVVVRGEVAVTGDDGFVLRTEELELDRKNERISSSLPVTFAQGDMRGEAGGLVHGWKTKDTLLTSSPVIRIVNDRTAGREITVRGQALRLDERKRRLEARGDSRIDFAQGSIVAANVDVEVERERDEVRSVLAIGNAVTTTRSPSPKGSLLVRTLSAQTIDHAFVGASLLRSVHAMGSAELVGTDSAQPLPVEVLRGDSLQLAFTGTAVVRPQHVTAIGNLAHAEIQNGERRENLTAGTIDVSFDAQGALSSVEASGRAATESSGGGGDRRLVAEKTTFSFGPEGSRVDQVQFEGGPARIVERQSEPGGVRERTVVAKSGDVEVSPEGEVVGGHLEGDVRLGTPTSTASSDSADIDKETGRTILTGNVSVETAGRISHGDVAEYDRKEGTVTVRGGQHTIVRDAGRAGGLDSLVSGTEPIYVSSDQLVVHETDRQADYTGGRPSVRRGDSELVADAIHFDDVTGSMDAKGKVESKLRLAAGGNASPSEGLFDPSRLVHGHSDEVRIRRAERLVTYAGTVKLEQGQARLTAADVDVHLSKEGGRVDRLEARGSATFKSPQWEAEGEVIDYHALESRVRVTAGRRPAKARDSEGHFVTGEILEKDLGADGWSVIAPAGGRTRGGAPSPTNSLSVKSTP